MRSIRTKIIAALFFVICISISLIISIIVINENLLSRYRKINQNIIYEQELKDNIWFLVEDSYNAFKSNDYTAYNKRLNDIKKTENILDTSFADPSVDKQTKLIYRGVKNSFDAVIQIIDKTKSDFDARGNIVGISDIFSKALVKFDFVKQNTTDLILAETKNIAKTTIDIQKVQNALTPIILGVLIIISLFLIIFSFVFANSIVKPLISLSQIAKSITEGNLTKDIPNDLLEKKDEIGSLSISFDIMMNKLNEKILGFESSDKDLRATALKLNEQVDETSKLNRLMVGRELKMIQLKEEINDLKGKLEVKT